MLQKDIIKLIQANKGKHSILELAMNNQIEREIYGLLDKKSQKESKQRIIERTKINMFQKMCIKQIYQYLKDIILLKGFTIGENRCQVDVDLLAISDFSKTGKKIDNLCFMKICPNHKNKYENFRKSNSTNLNNTNNDNYEVSIIMCPSWCIQMPPQGIAYLSESLKQNNSKVNIIDLNIELYESLNSEDKELWSFENHPKWVDETAFSKILPKFKQKIKDFSNKLIPSSNILCFSINAGNKLFTIELLKEIKKRKGNNLIILGGPGCKTNRDRKHFPFELVDYFILNKPQSTLNAVVKNYDGINLKKELFNINNKVVEVKEEVKEENIFPKYEGLNLSLYEEKMLPITMSNKCNYNCVFCDYNKVTPNFIDKRPEEVFEEISYHVKNNKIKTFTFTDYTFNNDLKKLETLCDLIINSKLDISWNCQMVARKGMTLKLFKKIKAAGCSNPNGEIGYGIKGGFITFGIESGSDRILKMMNKPTRVIDAEETLKNSHEAKITTIINLIVGFPGETDDDHEKTKDFLIRNKNNIDFISNISSLYIPPESNINYKLKKYNIKEKKDLIFRWVDNKNNNPKFRIERMIDIKRTLDKIGIKYFGSNESY